MTELLTWGSKQLCIVFAIVFLKDCLADSHYVGRIKKQLKEEILDGLSSNFVFFYWLFFFFEFQKLFNLFWLSKVIEVCFDAR